MKVAEVDFPEPLLAAIRDRELVVFAGAGVSMGEPAGLPGFGELADQIAAHTGQERGKDDAIDVFLGRLERDGTGVNVHGRAMDALSGKDGRGPEPTDLHRGLLRLYRKRDEVRLVTTNFDELFQKAAPGVFDGLPDMFRAPALPLGSDFAGIVHLHGSVRHPQRMVLTDRDFGRAYLTEGWARSFLVDLFRSYTVLFAGYSHEDVVVSYLARALPPVDEPQRFALVGSLTDEDDLSRWRNLGVEPILYPQVGKEDHEVLPVAVHALGDLMRRGALEWQRLIRDIAASSPPIDQGSNDLIEFALKQPENVGFFTDSAESAEWIGWLDCRGFLNGLLGDGDYGEPEDQLGVWLLWQLAASEPQAVLNWLMARSGESWAATFWFRIVVWLDQADDPPIEGRLVSAWISLLLENVPRFEADADWAFLTLAKTCARHSRWRDLAAVFEALLIRGAASLRSGPESHATIWLEKVWTDAVRPRLKHVAEPLLASAVKCLEQRQHLLEAWRPDLEGRDWSVTRRVAIEDHEGALKSRQPIDVAIDVARDALEWVAEHAEQAAGYWCERLITSNSTALRRLAVHGISIQEGMSATERIDWLLDHTDLHELGLRHEVFRVARESYRGATDESRHRLVERVLNFKGRSFGGSADQSAEHVEYEKFNWLIWLEAAAPDCRRVQEPLHKIRQLHPDFGPRADPDLAMGPADSYWVGSRSRWSADELLSQSPEQWVADLPAELPNEELGPDGRLVDRAGGLALEIGSAAARDPRWGLGVANALVAVDRVEEKFWPDLFRALGSAEEEVLAEVLGLFTRPELQSACLWERADVFRAALAEKKAAWTGELFPEVLAAAPILSEAARPVELRDRDEVENRGWWRGGFSHPAFLLAQFWLTALDTLRGDSGLRWGSAERHRVLDALSSCVAEESDFAAVSVSVLAGHVHFLLAVEEEWTRANLLPLFDAEAAVSGSATLHGAAWDGFLVNGRLSPRVAEALQPAFLNLTEGSGEFSDWKREHFLAYAATMMVHFVDDPLDEWVPRLFDGLDEDGRVQFVRGVGSCLEQASADVQLGCWQRWLRQHWLDRLHGVLERLTERETAAMFHWLSILRPVFPEAVDLAIRMPAVPGQRVPLQLKELGESYAGTENAQALAKLALHLSDRDLGLDRRDRCQLIERLLGEDLPEDTKSRLKAAAAVWGLES